MKIITVLGARPQFIKAATISREIRSRNSFIDEKILHTGQHFDENMSDIFFTEMNIPKPDYQLQVTSTTHGGMTGNMLIQVEEILIKEKPNLVLVYGDTNSTLAGALAAKKLKIPLAHVEAGLRSFNMDMPEEINRILTDRISNLLFAPSGNAIENLEKEGFSNYNCDYENVGDVMYDAALFYGKAMQKPKIPSEYVLATVHRAENTDDLSRLENIVGALNEISEKIQVIMPLHPRTKNKLKDIKIKANFETISPVGYLDMINLISNSQMVLTDSGGLQKEAFFFSKYCITMRDETEWTELVQHNFNVLAGADKQKIVNEFTKMIGKPFVKNIEPYGSGNAAEEIVDSLEKYLKR